MKMKYIGVRINEEPLEKLKYVSKYNGRSGNGHMLYLIKESISAFEKEHGEITDELLKKLNN